VIAHLVVYMEEAMEQSSGAIRSTLCKTTGDSDFPRRLRLTYFIRLCQRPWTGLFAIANLKGSVVLFVFLKFRHYQIVSKHGVEAYQDRLVLFTLDTAIVHTQIILVMSCKCK
jgi:hypothetical protein